MSAAYVLTKEDEDELNKSAIEREARERHGASEPYQARLASTYRRLHHFAFPPRARFNGSPDQWPAHAAENPDKIHITENFVASFMFVDARVQSILPRITIPTAMLPVDQVKRAEAVEGLALTWLEMSGWDVWFNTLCEVKSLYGKGVLKPFWDDKNKRGDVYCLEQPQNLRIGWGASDFTVKDWAIYEYKLSPAECLRRWKNISIEKGKGNEPLSVVRASNFDDPLGQQESAFLGVSPYRVPSDYEQQMVTIWDYWWREGDEVWNAILANGTICDGPYHHRELPDIPYIIIENDHELGSPDGVSTVETLLDLQTEFNRLRSHGAQHVMDNVDPAYYAHGDDAMNIEPGTVPKSGQILPVGNAEIEAIQNGVNTLPFSEMGRDFKDDAHFLTGLPPIMFGDAPADISGRATAIQVQSQANRGDPRRNRLYRGLTDLLNMWMFMAEVKDPKFELPDGTEASLKKTVEGFRRWKIIAPEVTPRDSQELVSTEGQKVTLGLSSARTSMDAIGVESPEAELELIRQERSDIVLRPDAVQQTVSVYPIMLQVQEQLAALQQQVTQLAQGAPQAGQQPPGGAGMSPTAQAQKAANVGQQQTSQMQAATGPVAEDQNQPLPGQQTLIRAGGAPGGQALNQISIGTGG